MKDSYWFKHDSNASRDIKLLKIKALYDFWGIGLFWSVVELLREQNDYSFQSDESGLDMVCSLVSCSDNIRFHNWFKDCLKFGLFVEDKGVFYSESLCERMAKWEVKKGNGGKGGRPIKTETETEVITETETETKSESKPLDKIREDKIREEYIMFISLFNSITGKSHKGTNKDKKQFHARSLEGFTLTNIETAIRNCLKTKYHQENPHYLTPEFITRPDKLQMYMDYKPEVIVTEHKCNGFVEVPGWVEPNRRRN
jgi:uncharacterized phage protein (TIGR02220 family)